MSDTVSGLRLRFVVLKSPFQMWMRADHDSFARLFHEMVGMKLRGYGKEYPAGVLPVDTSDLIATHLLVCDQDEKGELHPITGFKTTSLSDCLHHQIAFPALGLVQAAEAPQHIQAILAVMKAAQASGKSLSYTGSWTIEPNLRTNKQLTGQLIQMFRASYVFYHMDTKIDEVITGGTIRFKADSLLGNMGHDPLLLNGQQLPPIRVKHLFGEPVAVLHLKAFTKEAQEQSEPFQKLWRERIEISADSMSEVQRRLRAG